mmetsp:Transcript_28756/g.63304  ORF Transcript_28756/g.63304 Transcript_28756/m.63304 type:complete len:278 (+) Transcript_28756:227-1060(+)
MELVDCAFNLVRGVSVFDDPALAFKDLDYALLVGSKPRGPGMERNDLLKENAKVFVVQGQALNHAKPSCKVVVVGNPCNTNALIASVNCTTIPKENFSCLTMLDHTRATGLICEKLQVNNANLVEGVFILGNHSATQVPVMDFASVKVENDGVVSRLPVKTLINNDEWLLTDFAKSVQTRGATVIKARGASSAASAATAISKHAFVLHNGSEQIVSLGVWSDGTHYGLSEGIFSSFPVTVGKNGKVKIVDGFELSERLKKMVEVTNNELLAEKKTVL